MSFNSYIFIFLFLPISLLGYFFLNKLKKYSLAKVFLIGMSLWFYGYYNISYLWILILSIALNYGVHVWMLKSKRKKAVLVTGLLVNVGILSYFKYFTFLIEVLNDITHAELVSPKIFLPLGISFFTFQQIAFLADTYNGKIQKRQNWVDYALFVSFFPQLSSGPIVNSEEMMPQYADMGKKAPSAQNFYIGIRLFVLGLAKKVLLADTLAKGVTWGFQYHYVLDGMNSFLVILFYTFQIYLDFSGYTDMARGVGYMFNLRLPPNFLSPYKSKNIVEFWDRWHMTLTRFFTRYLYIPLGGNRKGAVRTYINVMIVFLVSGIWHGAGYTFIVWGLLHGLATVVTRLWFAVKKKFKLQITNKVAGFCVRLLSITLTFLFVAFTWTFFRAETITQAWEMITNVFTGNWGHVFLEFAELMYFEEASLIGLDELKNIKWISLGALIAISSLVIWASPNLCDTETKRKPRVWYALYLAGLFVWCVVSLSEVSSFLYVNF